MPIGRPYALPGVPSAGIGLDVGGFVGAGIGALTFGPIGYALASRRNDAIRSQIEAIRDQAVIRQQQTVNSAAIERFKNNQRFARMQALVRIAGDASGGGAFSAIERQSVIDFGLNQSIIDANLASQVGLIRSEARASAEAASSQSQNPLLAGMLAALQGAQAGLQVAGGIQDLMLKPTEVPDSSLRVVDPRLSDTEQFFNTL